MYMISTYCGDHIGMWLNVVATHMCTDYIYICNSY